MNFSEDRLTVSAVQTKDSLPIPVDLIIKIFSRLPAKSVARFRFLSKFWSVVIRSQYFIDLFAVNSSAQPQILFVNRNGYRDGYGYSFLSAHQPSDDPFDNITPTCLSHYPWFSECCYHGAPVNGLVCLTEYLCGTCTSLIYNPNTGESLTLPKLRTHPNTKNLLGYDPTEKQFKVLSLNYGGIYKEDGGYEHCLKIRVLTLETEELSWRTIECSKSHGPFIGEICINGVLYYRATCDSYVELIVCFHVRTETFRFINVMETFNKMKLQWRTVLTNYDGKLGLLMPDESDNLITGESTSFELRVLKDSEKNEWSEHVYQLPPRWKDVVGEAGLVFVGMIGTTEIVLSLYSPCAHVFGTPYFFSYNVKKNIVRRLHFQGKEASTLEQFDIFLNYVEDVSFYKLIN